MALMALPLLPRHDAAQRRRDEHSNAWEVLRIIRIEKALYTGRNASFEFFFTRKTKYILYPFLREMTSYFDLAAYYLFID